MNNSQRTNETPSIKPFGFTGIISQNSNLIVDKTFVVKGTSVVNAYDNSNVVLKDCASPSPVGSLENQAITKYFNTVKNERDSNTLPMWIEYIPKRYYTQEGEYKAFTGSKYFINLGRSTSTNEKVAELRAKITDNGTNSVKSENALEYQINLVDGLSTKNVSVTAPGTYILYGVENSIKTVFPLNSVSEDKQDNPAINLHFVNREVLDMTDNSNTTIYRMSDLDKTDEYGGKLKLSESVSRTSAFRKIVEVVGTALQYSENKEYVFEKDENGKYIIPLSSTVDGVTFVDGASFNNKNYVCYENPSTGKIYNAETPLTYYFSIDGTIYDLYSMLNGKYGEPSTFLSAYEYTEPTLEAVSENFSAKTGLPVTMFTENTSNYQPEEALEDCNFLGWKAKELTSDKFTPHEIYVVDSNGNNENIETTLLGFEKSELSKETQKFFKTSPDSKTIYAFDGNESVVLEENESLNQKVFENSDKTYSFDATYNLPLSGQTVVATIPSALSNTISLTKDDYIANVIGDSNASDYAINDISVLKTTNGINDEITCVSSVVISLDDCTPINITCYTQNLSGLFLDLDEIKYNELLKSNYPVDKIFLTPSGYDNYINFNRPRKIHQNKFFTR